VHAPRLQAVVDAFDPTFGIWRASTMVSVLGTGPVPTFGPPYVPVGPVVGTGPGVCSCVDVGAGGGVVVAVGTNVDA